MNDKRDKILFIDKLLSTMLQFTRKDIAQRFEERFEQPLQERTFYAYINDLQDEGAPIKKIPFGKEVKYAYEKPFSLSKTTLKLKDVQKLKQILKLLTQLKGLPLAEDLRAIVEHLKSEDAQSILFLDHKPMSIGTGFLGQLEQHIQKKEVIEIWYRHFKLPDDTPALKYTVHPYFLKEYERYWHLFGWNEQKQQLENYPLDRIKKINVASGILYRKLDANIQLNTFFNDLIGVTRLTGVDVEKYRIWANQTIAPYWRNRPLHRSQVEKEPWNDGVIFEFELRWNYEWQNKILYYGMNVMVLEPKLFRNKIQNVLKKALALYDAPQYEVHKEA